MLPRALMSYYGIAYFTTLVTHVVPKVVRVTKPKLSIFRAKLRKIGILKMAVYKQVVKDV